MTQIFGAPGKYIQGYDELKNIGRHIEFLGRKYLLLASKNRMSDLGKTLQDGLGDAFEITECIFEGESSWAEVNRVASIAVEKGVDGVIGMGGGKVIDTAKAAGNKAGTAVIIIPTIAASDASTGSLAVIYNEDGSMDREIHFAANPELVIVDTHVIMNAPTRFLVAGMGDALSTYIGGKVSYAEYKNNEYGAKPTEASMALCKLSYDLLMRHGLAAKLACDRKVMTKDLNKIIEVNVLLSGLGMESNGGGSDHTWYYAFCSLDREENMLHGEYVSLSTICSMVLSGEPGEDIDEVVRFCQSVGLPTTLAELQMDDLTEKEFDQIAQSVTEQDGPKNHPFEVTKADAMGALKTADAIGQLYKNGRSLL